MTEPTRCAVCTNYTLKANPKLARVGLGNCKLMPKWEFPNPLVTRECAAFKQVTDADLQARLEWEKTA